MARNWILVSAAVSAAIAGVELVRLIAGGAIHGFTPVASGVLSVIVILAMAGAAVGLALRSRWGWVAGVWAGVTSLGWGVVIELGGSPGGVGYLLGGAVMLWALVKSMPLFRVTAAEA